MLSLFYFHKILDYISILRSLSIVHLSYLRSTPLNMIISLSYCLVVELCPLQTLAADCPLWRSYLGFNHVRISRISFCFRSISRLNMISILRCSILNFRMFQQFNVTFMFISFCRLLYKHTFIC